MENALTFRTRLADLLAREHAALGEFLVALAEFDAQKLWIPLGYASLFDFLRRELKLSAGAAFYRKTAAELIGKFPQVIEPLRDGRLCLMTVAEVARVLTPENRELVLPRFFHLSKREAQALAAELQPHQAPPYREVVTTTRVPVPTPVLPLPAPSAPRAIESVLPVETPVAGPISVEAAPARATAQALTADLNRLHVTVTREFLKKLDAARNAMSHSNPGASIQEILEAGLDLLLDRHAKRNGVVKKPRPVPPPSSDPEHVPAHVRRAVWERDGGRCQHPLASGGACGSTVRVELHHRRSRHRGGPPTVENLTTLCGFHHDRETRREFGDDLVDRMVRGARGRGGPATDAAGERPS